MNKEEVQKIIKEETKLLREVVNKHSDVIKQLTSKVNELNARLATLESDPQNSSFMRETRKQRMGSFMDGLAEALKGAKKK